MLVLSKRLQMLADMVAPGTRLADVGCDHGFLSIYLVRQGICPRVLALDVRKGPLAGAGKHIDEYGLGAYIETRLSDGLSECGTGEADALVCAGMGGRLMERILTEGIDKAKQMAELILQPQSELQEFRAFLRKAGFVIKEENAVCEEGKYYFAMKAVPGQGGADRQEDLQEIYDLYGELLLKQGHPVLFQYLQQRSFFLQQLLIQLETADSARAKQRYEQIRREFSGVECALAYFEKH